MVLASAASLSSGTFPRFQTPVMLIAALTAGLLAWLTVRRRSTRQLAVFTPILLVLFFFLLVLMAPPRNAAGRPGPSARPDSYRPLTMLPSARRAGALAMGSRMPSLHGWCGVVAVSTLICSGWELTHGDRGCWSTPRHGSMIARTNL
jgi:hypothetical protein